MKPVRVLILIDRLGQGGVAQVAMNVAYSLNRDKYEPIICTTRDKPRNSHDELLRDAGVHLLELNRRSRWQLSNWKKLWQVLPTVTILHSHQTGSNFWGRLWGTLYRVPVIITQEHMAVAEKNNIEQWLDRALSRLSNKIITVSEYDQQQYIQKEKLPSNKVKTVYVGIDTEKFSPQLPKAAARQRIGFAGNKWLIGVIARLVPQKNHKGFLQAVALLPEDLKAKLHCLFVGNGNMQSELTLEARRLGLMDQVSFLGERQDVPVILRALDLLVLPSSWECLPSVVSESMAAGCPVVATAVGGVPEMIDNVGWPLVPPGDVHALAEAIKVVWQMPPAERNRIIAVGRQRVLDFFDREASAAHLERLYDTLLQEKTVRSSHNLLTNKSHL